MKLEVKQSRIHGKGLFATTSFKKGDLVGSFKGKPTSDEDDIHVLWTEEDGHWQGLKVTNILKFANHSKQPNVEVVGHDMYALEKIKGGNEITFDYGEEWI